MSEKLPAPKGKPIEPGTDLPRTPKVIVWAFVLSIFGIFLIPAIAAMVMTITGWRKVQESGKGRGLAIAALVISSAWLLIFVFAFLNQSTSEEIANAPQVSEIQSAEPDTTPSEAGSTTEEEVLIEDEIPTAEVEQLTETLGQSNARRQAETYLNFSAFSRKGLIEQLEFEGFSNEDATYGVESLGANWREQAAKKAREYLDFGGFSRQSLIEQLEFEGFTPAQAAYGADAVGY
jgi:hypothetical protein